LEITMLNVGVVGLGMMGLTHLDVYAGMSDVKVTAIADALPERLSGKEKAAGNIKGHAQGGFDLASAKGYADGMELIRDPNVNAVDICLPTPAHRKFAIAALEAGKHVLVEKPLARSSADAFAIADAGEKYFAEKSLISMPAMCMRFWPGWVELKKAIDQKTYGRVLSARFQRLASHPPGTFYANAEQSGAAALDLHIHDADFVRFCFGTPKAVRSVGHKKPTAGIDHISTQYLFDDVPVVTAEGGWAMEKGFPFNMSFSVNFEHGTMVFDLAATDPLVLYQNGQATPIKIEKVMGYQFEIEYFVHCVKQRMAPRTVTLRDAAEAVKIVEAEVRSVETEREVAVV
jgi:predicted dehydrogenase